jgi:hypothetical protein
MVSKVVLTHLYPDNVSRFPSITYAAVTGALFQFRQTYYLTARVLNDTGRYNMTGNLFGIQ